VWCVKLIKTDVVLFIFILDKFGEGLMGCFVVKEAPPQQQQQQIFKNSEPCSERGSFLAAQLFIGNTSRGSFGENLDNYISF